MLVKATGMAMPQKKNDFPSIKIGYQNVLVHVIDPKEDGRLEDSEGFYQSSQSMICINNRQCFSEQVATLFHECLHAIFYTHGMREIIDDKDKEEYVVNTMAAAVINLLKENPKLVDLVVNHGKS